MYKFILSVGGRGGFLGEFKCDKRRSAAAVLQWEVRAKPQPLGADPHKPQTEQHHSFPSPGWKWRVEKESQTLYLQICVKSTSKAEHRLCIRCGSGFLPSTWRSGVPGRASPVSQSGPGRGQNSEWNRFSSQIHSVGQARLILQNVIHFLPVLTKWFFSAGPTWVHKNGWWPLNHGYLDRFKSGGVVVGELLEDMSGSETKGAQAVQDGSLETWKRILKCGAFKYKWDQNTIWPEIPHTKNKTITIWSSGLGEMEPHLPWQQSWDLYEEGSSPHSGGTEQPVTTGQNSRDSSNVALT